MLKCENCNISHDGSYGSGRFCSSKCARGFSTKNKRTEINKKVSKSLMGHKLTELTKKKISENNGSHKFEIRKKIGRGVKKSITDIERKRRSNFMKNRIVTDETRKKISKIRKEKCLDINERKRLRDIGRKGGFGKKGYTKNGIRFESLFEKECFNFLNEKNVKFEPHKQIPNSSKVSDLYLNDIDVWIELDGINREYRKKWLGKKYDYWINKLKIYEKYSVSYF